LTMGNACPC